MNAINFQEVVKQFPKSDFVLSLPSLSVPEGYVTGFIGENGAGKTTSIKLMMGLLTANEGKIEILGQELSNASAAAAVRQQIGYVGETTGYLDNARLESIVGMVRPFYASWDDEALKKYLREFSLDTKKKHKELSKGQQKQFALALALARHPRLLILDEPTANLDPFVRDDILSLLSERIEQEGITVFFSTHITSDLDKIADYLRFLHHGKLLLEGEKDEMLECHRIIKIRRELADDLLRLYLVDCEQSEFGVKALTDNFPAVYDLLGDEAIYEKPTVEDLFLGYMRRERSGEK